MDCSAQDVIDKVNTGIFKAEKAEGTFKKIKGIFGKKKKAEEPENKNEPKDTAKVIHSEIPAPIKTRNTLVTAAGIDFSTLKRLTENINSCSGVEVARMKFNSDSSKIEILHTGTTENLLKLICETSKDIFTEKDITFFEEGKIAIALIR